MARHPPTLTHELENETRYWGRFAVILLAVFGVMLFAIFGGIT